MTDLNDPDLDPTEGIQVALYRRSKVCDDAVERELMAEISEALDDRTGVIPTPVPGVV